MVTKSKKTLEMIERIRNGFSEQDYQDYIDGNLKMKDVYERLDCNQNAMDAYFLEKGYVKRSNLRKAKMREDIFDNINSSESAYILGFYVADGCISGNKFIITLNEKDKEILEKIRDIISPVTKLCYHKKITNKAGITTNPTYTLSFASDKITNTLNQYGLGVNKTYLEKDIEGIIPEEYMWDFIRGFFDGDGCISCSEVKKKHITKQGTEKEYSYYNVLFKINSYDKLILENIKNFFDKFGIISHIYEQKSTYVIGIHSFDEIKKVYKHMYTNSSLYIERKRNKFDEIMEIPR